MVVIGAGCIGLLATAVAGRLGAAEVYVVEPHAVRWDRALDLGARGAQESVEALGLADSVDLIVDASGHPGATTAAIPLLRKRGRMIQMGVTHPETMIPVSSYTLYAKELTYLGRTPAARPSPRRPR